MLKKTGISLLILAAALSAADSRAWAERAENGAGRGGKADRPDRDKNARDRADKPDKDDKTDRPDRADKGERAVNREQREKEVDRREARQAKRIEHGIKRGALTPEEVETLNKQQQNIASLESSLKGDGKLTRDEAKQLNEALNTASRNIWGEKHDTDGKQLPAYRLGDNVFAKDEFSKKMADPNLSKEDARKLTHDFHRLTSLKRSLAADDLTAEQRAKLQNEYNDLLNKYFEVRSK